jgi:periplasmic protein CpxP/Spy
MRQSSRFEPDTSIQAPSMKTTLRHTAVPALLALALVTSSAWAQTPSAGSPTAASSGAATSRAQKHADYVEKKIDELHGQLKITPQQAQQWDAFAQTMRDNAQKTDQAFRDRAQKLPSENAEESMKSYAELAQLHADNMQKLATAFSALYATLSDEQKAIADPLFRNQHARPHAAPHKHKHVAPDASGASAPAPASN